MIISNDLNNFLGMYMAKHNIGCFNNPRSFFRSRGIECQHYLTIHNNNSKLAHLSYIRKGNGLLPEYSRYLLGLK